MDKFELMTTFAAVVNEGSFTRAAEVLNVSPQLVSKYVSHLESRLGTRLLNRTTRKVSVTEAGLRYVEQVRVILANVADVEAQMSEMSNDATGRLRISAPVSFATLYLMPLINKFQQRYPKVSIDLQLNDRKVDIVEEGFDIALRIGELQDSSAIAKFVAPVKLLVCGAPSYLEQYGTPNTLDDLSEHKLLQYSYSPNNPTSELLKTWKKHEVKRFDGQVKSNNGEVLTHSAIAGFGLTIQPSFIVASAISNGTLVRVLAEFEPKPLGLYAMYSHRQLLASKVRCFIDFIDGYYGSPPVWDKAIV